MRGLTAEERRILENAGPADDINVDDTTPNTLPDEELICQRLKRRGLMVEVRHGRYLAWCSPPLADKVLELDAMARASWTHLVTR